MSTIEAPKVCRIMAFWAISRGLGLSFYLLLGFRGGGVQGSGFRSLGFRVSEFKRGWGFKWLNY